ncbi:penicillin-binding protein 2 [Canibacter sp. lx-72]|uniref:peptidoglycan D,D-transpeptidase FtsI family protein n=1 Tax=Canibacter zhuwentaonis TaxID=2837491 RepID=UPI001BDD9A70|nr:penicillin-binding protein 2 [Canibacter zhuwentaonis]MBT1018664.1 penicillin-binding protein 2 [Canibacter zhuwentaonis]
MNKQLKTVTRTIFVMFLALFVALTMIQFVYVDSLRANPLNERTTRNSFNIERGAILTSSGDPIAYSVTRDDFYKFGREYKNGEIYAPITGYFSHYQGSSGIERVLNDELSGATGGQFFSRLSRIFSDQHPQGNSVQLTVDDAVQKAAFEQLQGLQGSIVALDPETGKILALASTPSYDPAKLSANESATVIKNYNELVADTNNPLYNRAIAGNLYIPGSVFKVLTTAAALESGKYNLDSEVADPAEWQLPGSVDFMRNYHQRACDNGDKVTLATALVRSCNIPFGEIVNELPPNALPDIAKAFGFGREYEIPLKVTASTIGQPTGAAQLALTSIGQFDARVTPLQMALVSATIANKGVQMSPTLVDKIITPDLLTTAEHKPTEFARSISQDTAAKMSELLVRSVTDESGLAGNAAIAGATVGGKTGTAQVGKDENGKDLPYTIWFTGFAEKDGRKVAVAVAIEEGGGVAHNFSAQSGQLPTQIGKKVMEAVLNK